MWLNLPHIHRYTTLVVLVFSFTFYLTKNLFENIVIDKKNIKRLKITHKFTTVCNVTKNCFSNDIFYSQTYTTLKLQNVFF